MKLLLMTILSMSMLTQVASAQHVDFNLIPSELIAQGVLGTPHDRLPDVRMHCDTMREKWIRNAPVPNDSERPLLERCYSYEAVCYRQANRNNTFMQCDFSRGRKDPDIRGLNCQPIPVNESRSRKRLWKCENREVDCYIQTDDEGSLSCFFKRGRR